MRKFFLLIFMAIILFSCEKKSFVVDDYSLKRDVDISLDRNGSLTSYNEKLVLSVSFSPSDQGYSFIIKSPDYDLSWESDIAGISELGITKGASFPSGSYHAIFYSDRGTETSLDIPLSPIDFDFSYINSKRMLSSRRSVSIVELDSNGDEINRVEDAKTGYELDPRTAKVQLSYTDRLMNNIFIVQEV